MIISTTIFLTVISMCILVLLRYSEASKLRSILIGILLYWLVIFGVRLYDILYVGTYVCSLSYILEVRNLFGGLVALWIFLLYPAYAIYPKLYRSTNILLSMLPCVVTYSAYFIWCGVNGVDVSTHIKTFDELLSPENRPIFYLRVSMLVSFVIYYGVLVYSLIRIINLYQRYIDGVYSSAIYNILWLKTYVKSLLIIGIVFLAATINMNIVTYWLYALAASISFLLLTDNALRYKQFERSSEYEVKWSFKSGWYVLCNGREFDGDDESLGRDCAGCAELSDCTASSDPKFEVFEKFVRKDDLYCRSSLTIKDVANAYPEFDYVTVHHMLHMRGHTFQSYIRHLRIERAMELILLEGVDAQFKQVATIVGFSHISSFNRAFLAEQGITPGEYRANNLASK